MLLGKCPQDKDKKSWRTSLLKISQAFSLKIQCSSQKQWVKEQQRMVLPRPLTASLESSHGAVTTFQPCGLRAWMRAISDVSPSFRFIENTSLLSSAVCSFRDCSWKDFCWWFSISGRHQNHLACLLKPRWLGHPQSFSFNRSWWDLRIYILKKLPSDANASPDTNADKGDFGIPGRVNKWFREY